MTDPLAERPFAAQIDALSGSSPGFADHYIKSFGALTGVYQDDAMPKVAELGADQDVAYEVFSTARAALPGALTVGTSVLNAGKVGSEFAMTRGHLHQIADRAEIYFGLSGHGVMLLESLAGEIQALEVLPGSLVYVPGSWIHRSVNVGSDPLVSLFCFSADAGQDYEIVERSGGMRKLVVADEQGGWTLRDNPRYVPREAS
jgi:glucose-6-phosphate isomerase